MKVTELEKKRSRSSVYSHRIKRDHELQFVVCLNNSEYPASLEVHKIYQVIPDSHSIKRRMIRIIDESGEDYLYPVDCFAPIEVPRSVEESFAIAV